MRQSASFFCRRKALPQKGYGLHPLVVQKVQTSPVVSQGWTKDTLLALFEYSFESRG
jgi:hypothetical protein